MSQTLSPQTTLAQARAWLWEHIRPGANCPTCGQRSQLYRRQVNAGMAHSLIRMYWLGGASDLSWVHIPSALPARSREEGKLAYWGLAQESTEPREDGGRAGWWRVTPRGERYVLAQLSIPKYALVFDSEVWGFEGEMVGITQALGTKFNYTELMEGR